MFLGKKGGILRGFSVLLFFNFTCLSRLYLVQLHIVMKIIKDAITLDELKQMAALFGNIVKAVVDVDKEFIAVDAELHSDLEALLLENGSKQKDLWGINFYPEMQGTEFIEFDSMINMKPSQGNRSRGIDDGKICARIRDIAKKRIKR